MESKEAVDRKAAKPTKWEWVPVGAVALLALLYCTVATPGGSLSRFCMFAGLGLLPGALWRLSGRPSWSVHRIFFAVTLIAFVFSNPDLRPDRASLAKMTQNWHLVAIGFAISLTQPIWGMLRTERLLTDSGVVLSANDSFKLCLAGSFFNIFLPGATGGDAYRVYVITHGYRTKLAPAIASITLDRILSLPSLLFVLLIGMILDYSFFRSNVILSSMIPIISGASGVCMALVIYLVFAGKTRRRSNWTRPYESRDGELPSWFKRTHAMIATNVKRRSTLPLTLLYGVLSHIGCIGACLCFGLALGVDGVPAVRYFLIVPMVMTINSIPGAPGGVGQGELAMATLLEMASPGSANAQDGVMIMLLFRLSNMVMGIVGGVYYAMGKMDFSGIDHVSQGLTRIMTRSVSQAISGRFPRRLTQRYEQVKESQRRYYTPRPMPERKSRMTATDTALVQPHAAGMVFDMDEETHSFGDER